MQDRFANLANLQKAPADGRSYVMNEIPITKRHLELLKLAAAVRKTIYGSEDTVALTYDKAVSGDEALLKRFAALYPMFEQNDRRKAMRLGVTPNAKDTVATAFSTPIAQISELKGGGLASSDYYDAWVRFKSSAQVELREQNGFSKVAPAEAVKAFLSLCPQDSTALCETANLICLQVKCFRTDLPNGQWLLSNKKRRLYWYRTWH